MGTSLTPVTNGWQTGMVMSRTVTECLRDHLLSSLGYPILPPARPFEELWETEWCADFERKQRYKLIFGSVRYGLLGDKCKPQWDRLGRIERELVHYRETGDLEALVEIANHAMLEYVEGVHPLRHYGERGDDSWHTEAL